MKFKTHRESEEQETKILRVTIGDTTFRLQESVDGRLCITKSNLDHSAISVFPRVSNEIELT